MKLPSAPAAYSAADQSSLRALIEQELSRMLRRGVDIELGAGERIIILSANGSRWALTASDAGALTLVAA